MAAPNGLIVGWPLATAIPSGWSRYTALDGRIPFPQSTSLLGTGGSDTHTHTEPSHFHDDRHYHTAGNSGNSSGSGPSFNPSGSTMIGQTHPHQVAIQSVATPAYNSSTVTATESTANNNIANYTVRWIKADGTTDIPVGAVAWSNQAVMPAGWQAHAASVNLHLRGAAAAANGGVATAGASHSHTHAHTHTHGTTAHTHVGSVFNSTGGTAGTPGAGVTVGKSVHTHPITGVSGSVSHNAATSGNDPNAYTTIYWPIPYFKLEHVEATAAAEAPSGIIGLFETMSPPSGWVTCDGGNGSPNLMDQGRWVLGATGSAQIGVSGGGATHQHSAGHAHAASTSLTGAHGAGSLSISNNTADSVAVVSGAFASMPVTHSHTIPASWGASNGALASNSYVNDLATMTPPYQNLNFIMKKAAILVQGNQPEPTGKLNKGKVLFGAQPSASGAVSFHPVFRHASLAGSQPAATGTVSRIKGHFLTRTGSQPGASGTVAAYWTLENVTIRGNQPAASSTLTPIPHVANRVRLPAGRVTSLERLPSGTVKAVRPGR